MIECQASAVEVGSWTLVVLPSEASQRLPSRGMCLVEGEINGAPFQTPLEPDGRGSHWFQLTDSLSKVARAKAGSALELLFAPSENWPDPALPSDVEQALKADAAASSVWSGITSKARWDWIRWIRSTANPQTRHKRIETACSMLSKGKRRPCCFDRNRCTEPEVSSNGLLKNQG